MKLYLRLILIALAVLLILVAYIGAFAISLEFGYQQPNPRQEYADSFASSLLLGVIFSSIALIFCTTRIRKFSIFLIGVFMFFLVSRNPWAFKESKSIYGPDNPWENKALVLVVIAGLVASGISIYFSYFANKRGFESNSKKQVK